MYTGINYHLYIEYIKYSVCFRESLKDTHAQFHNRKQSIHITCEQINILRKLTQNQEKPADKMNTDSYNGQSTLFSQS